MPVIFCREGASCLMLRGLLGCAAFRDYLEQMFGFLGEMGTRGGLLEQGRVTAR
jgi:hypothetical protein